ncbi:MAG: gamma carbonic anhydrase family protein [Gammaproteobacteria bacterium]
MPIRGFQGITPRIAASAFIDETALVIGDVAIGEHSSLWPMAVARGDVNSIALGNYTNIQDGTILHVTHDSVYYPGGYALRVGDHVTVGHRVILHGCEIGDYCLVGMGAVVMDGAVLEPRVLLGAGSLVPSGKRLHGDHLWVGSPVRCARALTEQEREGLVYAAAHYARLKDRHRAG